MKTYDGVYDGTCMMSNEDTQKPINPTNLTETLVGIDKTNREIINELMAIGNHLFGEAITPNVSADANCFTEQLEKNHNMAIMILNCVISIREKIGA